MARSLLDGIDVKEKAAAHKTGADKSKVKLLVSVGLLVVALGVLAWYYFVPAPAPTVEQPDPAETARIQQQNQQEMQRAVESGRVTVGGS